MLIHLKDSQQSSRLLRWRLKMEEYDYGIEYVKGKENKVADYLSRHFPITSDISKTAMWEAGISDEEDGTVELKNQPQKIEISGTLIITEDRVQKREEKINLPPRRMSEPSEEKENESTEDMTPEKLDMHTEFINWRVHPTFGKVKTKPNATGKLWKEIKKEEMSDYDEVDWVIKLSWIIEEINNK